MSARVLLLGVLLALIAAATDHLPVTETPNGFTLAVLAVLAIAYVRERRARRAPRHTDWVDTLADLEDHERHEAEHQWDTGCADRRPR